MHLASRLFVLSFAGLLVGLAASASRAQEPPLVWEVVGQPVDAEDRWPDTDDIFVTDTAAYANGIEGLFVIRPGDSDFTNEPWALLQRGIPFQGVYATSTGVLFAIADALSRSTDGGLTWEGVFDDSRSVLELPSRVLVASENACCGIGRSTDDGATWTLIDLDDLLVPRALGYAPPSPARAEGVVVAVGRDGAAYSNDEGLTWTPSNLIDPFAYFGETAIYSAYHDALFAGINGDPGPDAPPGTPGSGLVWASVDGSV